jgi:hypothetical protein
MGHIYSLVIYERRFDGFFIPFLKLFLQLQAELHGLLVFHASQERERLRQERIKQMQGQRPGAAARKKPDNDRKRPDDEAKAPADEVRVTSYHLV